MKFATLFLLMFVSACAYVEVTRGTATERIKFELRVHEACKVRVKLSKQLIKCKWEI